MFLQVLCICYVLFWRLQSRATTRPMQPGTNIQTWTDSQCLSESLGQSSWEVRQQRSSVLGNLCLPIGQLVAMRQMNSTSRYCICFRWAADVKKFSLRTRVPWPPATWTFKVGKVSMCHVLCQPCFASFWSRRWRCSSLPRSCLCLWALGSLTLVPFLRNWFEKARPFHMHQQGTCNLPQCIAEQVFKSKACLVLYWRRYDVHCTAAHTSLHKGKYTFVRPNKVFRTLASCHALGVAELKKNAVLTSLHPLPHQLLMQILASGAAS